ncbi:hypothetical protein V8C86DRAFT_2658831, partial [Haematococcus lacustris]
LAPVMFAVVFLSFVISLLLLTALIYMWVLRASITALHPAPHCVSSIIDQHRTVFRARIRGQGSSCWGSITSRTHQQH